MKKYKHSTKKGQTVYYVEVNYRSGDSENNSTNYRRHGITVTPLKIVHQTKSSIALSSEGIKVLRREALDEKNFYFYTCIDTPSIDIETKETYFPNGVFATVYTLDDPDKIIPKVKKAMIDKVNNEYAFLFGDFEGPIQTLEINK